MKLSALLETQFKKLGIDTTTDELKAILALDTEVPEDIAKKINTGLLTIDAAKTNSDVVKSIRKEALDGVDAKIDNIIKELGVTVGEDFAANKNSYDKVGLLGTILFNEGKKKGEGNSKDGLSEVLKKEREAFTTKEAEYNRKLKEATDSLTNKDVEFKTTRQKDLTGMEMYKKLLGKDYVFPKEMDNDIKVATALGVVETKLKSLGLQTRLNEAGQLVITDKDGNKAYNEKHEPIDSVDDYFTGVLTQSKLLNLNDPTKQQQNTQGQPGTVQTQTGIKNPAIVADLANQLASLPD